MKLPLNSFALSAAGLVVALGLLSGCVSQDAGYQDLRRVVASRTGHGRVVLPGLPWWLGRSVYRSAAVRFVPTGTAAIGLTGLRRPA